MKWAGAAFATQKFHVIRHPNFYFALWQWLKAGFLLMAVTGVMVYGLRLFHYSRLQGFGTVVLLMVLEAVALGVYFSARKCRKIKGDIESVDQVRQALTQERYDLNVDIETVRKLNDCRRLNVHFLSLHRMLLPGGYFAGYAHTIKTHYNWIYSRFPRPMAHAVYALDFLVHRVAPKRSGLGGQGDAHLQVPHHAPLFGISPAVHV